MSKLFEEALADAKKLKQVAEENAKKAILESITPKIKEFIDQQIIEQSDVQEGENCSECGGQLYEGESHTCEDSDVNLDEDSIASLMEMLGVNTTITKSRVRKTLDKMNHQQILNLNEAAKKANSDDKLQSNEINKQYKNLFEEISMNKERYYEVDLQALREAVEQQADDLHAESELKKEMEGMYNEESEDEESSEGYVHEVSEEEEEEGGESDQLEEMLQEIKLALDLGEEIEEDMLPEELRALLLPEDDEEGEESLDDEEDSDELPPLEDMEGEESEEEEEGDDELPPLEEVFDIDPNMLREELANIRRSLSEGKVDHHFGGKAGGSAGVDGSFGGKGNKNAGVKNSFGGGSEGQDPFVSPPQINKLNEAIRQLSRKNRAQKEKLNKYRGAVQTLREQLEDLNLFNAKLLYVNKLLQNKSLNESQKKSIIRALDEAKSLGETKSLYKSLTESLARSTKKSTLSESTRFGSSSRTTTSASSQGTKTVGESDRWAKLAGLK